MKLVTSSEMRGIDTKTIKDLGMPGMVLMERAGLGVEKHIVERFEPGKVLVVCGGGNNGGDGLVIARLLHQRGWNVKAVLLKREKELSPDCLHQFRLARKFGVNISLGGKIEPRDLHASILVDAIFGTGLGRAVRGVALKAIEAVNSAAGPVVSVDIPSGVSSDTGKVLGGAVRADVTVTFGLPKRGHYLHPGCEYSGDLYVEDIGFPTELLEDDKLTCEIVTGDMAAGILPERPTYSHKGHYGHTFIVAGSTGRTGAALLAAGAALRAGAGLVTLGVPSSLMGIFQSRVTEEMTLPLEDSSGGVLSPAALDQVFGFLDHTEGVLALGPGIGTHDDTRRLVHRIVSGCTSPMVIDADGINCIADKTGLLKKAKAPLILTPHPGEMARLCGLSGGREVEKDRIGTATGFASKTGTYIVLKGVPTITATPEGISYVNTTGNPGMATAGAGDVLTGIIAALLGQGLTPEEASVLGTYIHGLSGDIASEELGMHSLVASDIIDWLPKAFRILGGTCDT